MSRTNLIPVFFIRQLKRGYVDIDARFDPMQFRVHAVTSFPQAMLDYPKFQPRLAFLDYRTLAEEAEEICRLLRRQYPILPVIAIVGRRGNTDCQCAGLLRPPYTPRRLTSVGLSVLEAQPERQVLQAGPIQFNLETLQVSSPAGVRRLSPKLASLLQHFMQFSGRVCSRQELIEAIWKPLDGPETLHRTLEVHVYWLRQAIEPDPRRPQFLRTVRGYGYRFTPSEDE